MIWKNEVSKVELLGFNKSLSLMLLSRLSILQALDIIYSQTKNNKFKTILNKIISDIKAGSSLSKSFSKYPRYFSAIYIANLKVAEETGEIAEVLGEYTKFQESIENLKRKVIQAARYPLLVLFVAFIVVVFMVFFMIPTFQGLFFSSKIALPPLTAFIMNVSILIKDNYLLLFFIFVLTAYLINWSRKIYSVKVLIDNILVSIPVISKIYSRNILARFSVSMAILLKSSVNIIEALKISKNISDNRLFKYEIEQLIKRLIKGETLAQNIMNSKFFDITFVRMLTVGEESAELEKVFSLIANYYTKEFDYYLDNLTSLIEPVLILVIGIIVAVILVAMYLPMFELVNNFGM